MAALAATCAVSIFAAQVLLLLAVLVFAARLWTGGARLQRTPLDGPILALKRTTPDGVPAPARRRP